ncbi:hypothetical protein HMPREF0501_01122 [Limosilactobacillus coleohominis 101-4-CHN]|uniref:Uncharacterized protein n=1 Tax=Limosilactobacillus coleohominis 101-4-CHN TaxID=575594 RepID=C7XW57_9LACO|nr:hypothetical protein [Limosilactobacillus coleohominis]EEU30117.1 hypothetical protein HMPREF0501_01122 [Limosilactobacillus coleohominis 101-4-CHN]
MTEIQRQVVTAPRNERETIITYDRETETWHIYTDEPKHARKFEKYVSNPERKAYNVADQLIMLEGDIDNGTVNIREKVPLTDLQKKHLQDLHKKPWFLSNT